VDGNRQVQFAKALPQGIQLGIIHGEKPDLLTWESEVA
jgi:hypothetical protein